jgi:hypothetical protein
MAFHPASNEGTQRAYLQASSPRVVEGISGDCAAHPPALILLGHHGVQEDDGVIGKFVLGDASQRAVDPSFISAYQGIVLDSHAHGCQLCQKLLVWIH